MRGVSFYTVFVIPVKAKDINNRLRLSLRYLVSYCTSLFSSSRTIVSFTLRLYAAV